MSETVRAESSGKAFELEFPTASDHISQVIRKTGTFYEAEMLADARTRLFFPECAVDVGAHVGNHTIYFAGVLGLRTVSFEPNPSSFSQLSANVAANGLSHLCHLNPVAVGDRPGRGHPIPGLGDNSGMARVESAADGEVRVVTLDEELAGIARIDLLKIDVEGWEGAVLKGARRTLDRCRPLIYVEVSAANFVEVRTGLAARNYVCWKCFNATPTFLFLPEERFFGGRKFSLLRRH